uniref:Glyco_hydro_38C domain-containing protein n=1 Tax=Heterorhabditis bacteriophora TaxID=37862 RepID=A0A1I7X606_HETBA
MRSTNVTHPSRVKIGSSTVKSISIQNEDSFKYLELSFDSHGFLTSITEKDINTTYNFRQGFFYYKGMGNSTQPSGAYIFRPAVQEAVAVAGTIKIDVIKGNLVEEVRQTLTPWLSQIIRLYKNSTHIEFDWVVGPIPKEENREPISKEVVTRYFTDIHSEDIFFTDANGRQMMRREVNKYSSFKYDNTEPVAGNYYPISNRIYIKDAARIHRPLAVEIFNKPIIAFALLKNVTKFRQEHNLQLITEKSSNILFECHSKIISEESR